ncbi:MAG: flagellar basal body-associated FliL family protein [Lachnospiraceae bacterium]|nr:flagellar basal body-associated FliL family protein [Lachnospiraceae bacterium]
MKKNLMSVLILALLVVNLVLTAMLTFTVMPATSNANKLIEEVANAIHLELNTGKTTGQNNIPLGDIETYKVNDASSLTIALKKSDDGKDHYCVVDVFLSINKTHEDYDKWNSTTLATQDSVIKNAIISVLSRYTKDELMDPDNQYEATQKIRDDLAALLDSDIIVSVGFSSFMCQ